MKENELFSKTPKTQKIQISSYFCNLLPKTRHTALNFEVDEKKIKKIEEKGEGSKMSRMSKRTKFKTINYNLG